MPKTRHPHKTKTKIPVIKCSCGAVILVVPDIKKMSDAIEKHVEEHVQKGKHSKNGETTEQIRENLIAQTLNVAKDFGN
ncbi:MAG: hypothetical protein ACQXXJ_05295 [Candidatus Bathyarchaeia archaeon]